MPLSPDVPSPRASLVLTLPRFLDFCAIGHTASRDPWQRTCPVTVVSTSATSLLRGPAKPIVRRSPQRYHKTSTVEINSGARHREVVQLAKRVRVYPAAGRRQGCVRPYLGCRESRPQGPQ